MEHENLHCSSINGSRTNEPSVEPQGTKDLSTSSTCRRPSVPLGLEATQGHPDPRDSKDSKELGVNRENRDHRDRLARRENAVLSDQRAKM